MGRACRSVLAVVVVILYLLVAHTASADSKLEQAQKHFRQGQAYFKAGTFDKAIVEYTAAYDLAPRSSVLFNIGLCHENAGEMEKAIAFYDRFLAVAPDEAKSAEALARRGELVRAVERKAAEAKNLQLATAKRAAGNRALGASDWDTAIAELKASYALVSDPEVLYELAEAYRENGDAVLARAEYKRYLSLAEHGNNREDAGRRVQEIDEAERAKFVSAEPRKMPMEREPRGSLIPAIAAFSVAGVAATVGVVFGLKASSIASELDDQLAVGNPPLDTGDPRIDDGKSAALAANISYGAAGVATIVGAYVLYKAFDRDFVPVKAESVIVIPTASPGRVGLALETTF